MTSPLLELWSRTSAADKALLQDAFGDLEARANVVVLICKAHIRTKESSPVDIAMTITVLRDLLGPFWFEEGVLVKEDAERFFITCTTIEGAARLGIHAIRRVEALRQNTPLKSFLEGLSCGVASGEILMREGPGGDIFGVPADTACKLAEQVANPGELLIAQTALTAGQGGNNWPYEGITCEVATAVISNSSVKYSRLKGPGPLPDEHAEMLSSLEEEDAEDPIIQLFLSLVKGQDSQTRAPIEQHISKMSILATDMSGVNLVAQTKGLVQYLLLIAKERVITKDSMVKYGGEIVKYDADKVIARFDHPIPAMGCAAEAQARLAKQSMQTRNDPCRIIMCVGAEHGEILNTGDDLFGWAWDVAYALSESAEGTSHDVLLGPGLLEATKHLWEAPQGTKLEARPVSIRDSKLACQRLVASVAPMEASGGAITRHDRRSLQMTGDADGGAYPRPVDSVEERRRSMQEDPFLRAADVPDRGVQKKGGGLSLALFCCSGRRG